MPRTTHRSSLLLSFALISVSCDSASRPSVEEAFRQCLVSQPGATLGHCLGVGAIGRLRSWDGDPEFDLVDGVTLSRSPQQYREAYSFADGDPADFRTWIDSLSHVFSHRSLQWDMGFVYPGLSMRVAPSTLPGGHLEFILDPHREVLNKHSLKELGTGRLLARQFLVPLLLGFKFNVATLTPILFGLLALIAKKAIVISKIALIVSTAYGLATLLGLGSGDGIQHSNYHSGAFSPGFGGGSQFHHNRYPADEYPDVHYRDNNNNVDHFELRGQIPTVFPPSPEKRGEGRNFAWSDKESA